MHTITEIQDAFTHFITQHYPLLHTHESIKLILNTDPERQQFGDFSTSAPLILAKQLKKSPLSIARDIATQFKHSCIQSIEIAPPGFLNMCMTDEAYQTIAWELFDQRSTYFKSSFSLTTKKKTSIEFVSANPTGPLHFGHGRGGIIGDVLGNVFSFFGYTVVKEFYINDAGSQIEKLAMSLIIRCQQLLGIEAELPEDAYHGEYLKEIAQKCITENGINVLEKSESFFQEYAKEHLLKEIKETLIHYGIQFDTFFSEKTLHQNAAIEQAIDMLTRRNLIYQHEGALWFATTKFGDDKDRVVRKASGEWTYVAADIAYLKNKADRGFTHIIMVLGHDHHSYAVRLHAIRQALEIQAELTVILYQLVKIKEDGTEIKMSKRKGTMVALEDIIQTVGKDIARFFYLHRKADAQLDFDLNLALKKTEENPVYYIQYAYVRIRSVLTRAQETIISAGPLLNKNDAFNITKDEYLLIKKVASFKNILEAIVSNHQTHTITYYLLELAHAFHTYYAHTRVIDLNNIAHTRARLLVLFMAKRTLAFGLDLLSISKPEKM